MGQCKDEPLICMCETVLVGHVPDKGSDIYDCDVEFRFGGNAGPPAPLVGGAPPARLAASI